MPPNRSSPERVEDAVGEAKVAHRPAQAAFDEECVVAVHPGHRRPLGVEKSVDIVEAPSQEARAVEHAASAEAGERPLDELGGGPLLLLLKISPAVPREARPKATDSCWARRLGGG